MPHAAARDHGVAEQHWLLDRELAERSARCDERPRPALLRHETVAHSDPPPPVESPAPAPRNFSGVAVAVVAALSLYLMAQGAQLGDAVRDFLVRSSARTSAVMSATSGLRSGAIEAGAADVAALRSLLAREKPERNDARAPS